MANTYTLIASNTVGSGGVASITFSSIPSTYTDLCIKYSIRDTFAGNVLNVGISFNGSSSGYSERLLYGNGSTAASGNASGNDLTFQYATGGTTTSSTFASGEIYVPNYAGSTNKSVSVDSVTENNATAVLTALNAALWSNTAAINQVTLLSKGTLFAQHSTAYLYGISNS
jgi:hypothetical protein